MVKVIIMAFTAILVSIIALKLEVPYTYNDFKDYCGILLPVSGMVFTIMGIWIAFVYPNAILRLQDPEKIQTADFSKTMSDTRRLEVIVGTIMKSAFVAFSITLIFFTKLAFSQTQLYLEHIALVKSIALGIIFFLTLIQSSALINVIYSNFLFVDDLHNRRESKERSNDF